MRPGAVQTLPCNFFAGDLSSGFDANGNLLISRTLKGGSGCEDGNLIAKRELTYDHRDRAQRIVQTVVAPGDTAVVTRMQSFDYRGDDTLRSSVWKDGEPGVPGASRTTAYQHSDGALLDQITDWRGAAASASSFTCLPSGSLASASLGSDIASAELRMRTTGTLGAKLWLTAPWGGVYRERSCIRTKRIRCVDRRAHRFLQQDAFVDRFFDTSLLT
jgi:hypothetical protein